NPYHRARAVWLLSQLGQKGIKEVEALLNDANPNIKVTALRALKQANPSGIIDYAQKLVKDTSAAVRREVAIALKDIPLDKSNSLILALTEGYDGKDPWYLNALGIALEGKENDFYPTLLQHYKADDPEKWSETLFDLVWRIHPSNSVGALHKRVNSKILTPKEKERALVALAFITTMEASEAVRQLADTNDAIAGQAQYWLQFRKTNDWRAYLKDWKSPTGQRPGGSPQMLELREKIVHADSGDSERQSAAMELAKSKPGQLHLLHLAANNELPDTLVSQLKDQMLKVEDRYLLPLVTHYFDLKDSTTFDLEDIAELNVNPAKGKVLLYSNCIVCHKVGEVGGELGPILSNIQAKYGKTGILEAIINPDSGIAFGS
ncbi:MAG: HEAT repeat domain-containing protein, partial [Anditalea sp.]